ncbi:MAG: hypothetical protein K2N40_02415, partial [Ureaplasma sp.]|nr:hypothetical protein [Ureaplasma sp.]
MTNFELLFKLKQSLIKNNQNEKISNWILMHVYDLDDYTDLMNILPLEAIKNNECELILKEYLAGKPLSKIFGSTYFCCNKFIVDNNVFSPRVETELLIEYLSKYINKFNFISDIDFLDMCCGTGVIG